MKATLTLTSTAYTKQLGLLAVAAEYLLFLDHGLT